MAVMDGFWKHDRQTSSWPRGISSYKEGSSSYDVPHPLRHFIIQGISSRGAGRARGGSPRPAPGGLLAAGGQDPEAVVPRWLPERQAPFGAADL